MELIRVRIIRRHKAVLWHLRARGWVAAALTGTLLAGTAVLSAPSAQAAQTVPAAERAALVSLYKATGGAEWDDNSGWNTSTSVCTWNGVTCAGGHIAELELSELNLSGKVPSSLGKLTRLTYLDLSDNRLSSVPSSLGKLTKLRILDLGGNGLSSVPSSLGNLTKLTYLYLNNNGLSSVPSSLGKLTKLTILFLGGNGLSSVPSWLGNLTRVTYLNLSGNQLSSVPSSLGKLTRLTILNLSSNGLTSVPSSLGNLTKLNHLDLSDNRLSGDITGWVTGLHNAGKLKYLSLAGNSCLSVSGAQAAELTAWLSLFSSWNSGCSSS